MVISDMRQRDIRFTNEIRVGRGVRGNYWVMRKRPGNQKIRWVKR